MESCLLKDSPLSRGGSMVEPEYRYVNLLIPFHAEKELPDMMRKLLKDYYRDLEVNNLLKRCLHDVVIKSYKDFVSTMATQIFFLIIDTVTKEACAHVMLNGRYGNIMLSHFAVLPSHWGVKAERVCKEATIQLIDLKTAKGKAYVSGFIGITPIINRLAIKFSQKTLQFKPLGVLKDLCYLAYEDRYVPGVISKLEKDTVLKWRENYASK